jgi:hypothetical protein
VIKLNGWFNHSPMAARSGAMDIADLIDRAARYRALAAHVTDEQTRVGLLELAERYEALAREVRESDPPQAQ